MIERDSIRVIEPSDDADAVSLDDGGLPILEWVSGWILRYLDSDGQVHEHLIAGQLEDVELAVQQARAYLDRQPRSTSWPHN
jgi:hypothetical protein